MIREAVSRTVYKNEPGFHWRGGEVSRIEGFSDAVFGFALTLLIVSLETPKTFNQLQEALSGFVIFAATFALFVVFWHEHYQFFRRYGLNDMFVMVMNFFLLFVVVFYVYPLKFLATVLIKMFSGQSNEVMLNNGAMVKAIENSQWSTMMIIYGVGFILIYGIYFLLYLHAFRLRKKLELTETELVYTVGEMKGHAANCAIGALSILFVLLGGLEMIFYSGMTYWLIGPVQGYLGYLKGKKIRRLLSAENT